MLNKSGDMSGSAVSIINFFFFFVHNEFNGVIGVQNGSPQYNLTTE